jgi:HEAT repeat protein
MKEKDAHFVAPVIDLMKKTKSDQVLEHAADVLSKLDNPSATPALKEAAGRDLDAELQVHVARAILDLRDPEGFAVLVKVLESDPPKFAREEALQLAEERNVLKLDPAALKKWWMERGAALKWKNESRKFE